MKKLKLELDRLEVQSFVISQAPAHRGTVRAHGGTLFPYGGCGGGGTTVIPNYCYPNSDVMDCIHMQSASCDCPTPVE